LRILQCPQLNAFGKACVPLRLLKLNVHEMLVTLYLAYLGFIGGLSGILLWPAVALTF
jgi:hypothetical protein